MKVVVLSLPEHWKIQKSFAHSSILYEFIFYWPPNTHIKKKWSHISRAHLHTLWNTRGCEDHFETSMVIQRGQQKSMPLPSQWNLSLLVLSRFSGFSSNSITLKSLSLTTQNTLVAFFYSLCHISDFYELRFLFTVTTVSYSSVYSFTWRLAGHLIKNETQERYNLILLMNEGYSQHLNRAHQV